MDLNTKFLVCVLMMCTLYVSHSILLDSINQQFEARRMLLFQITDHLKRINARRTVLLAAAAASFKQKRKKRFWKKNRSGDWWKEIVSKNDDEEWYENFRMRRGTFDWLCDLLDPLLKPHPKPVAPNRPIISTKTRVAIALFKLAHLAEYKVVGYLFGVHKSSVHNCLYSFCIALCDLLAEDYIKFPDENEAQDIAERFEKVCFLPNIIGAIDGSHIPVTPPIIGKADFTNRKGSSSIVLQAIVDDQYLFRDVSCKLPGSCNDRDALYQSNFFRNVENVMPKGTKRIDDWNVPYMILGDPAYPLLSWLLKNYDYDRRITPEQDSFNVYMNKARVVVENAFGRLKARWRVLCRASDISYKFLPTIVVACCILHNICERSKESHKSYEFRMSVWANAARSESVDCQPATDIFNAENNFEAVDIRDHMMLYLARKCPLLSCVRGRVAVM